MKQHEDFAFLRELLLDPVQDDLWNEELSLLLKDIYEED